MKVLHVTPSFYPARAYGGAVLSTFELCRGLARSGCEVRVLTTDAHGLDRVVDVDTEREIRVPDGFSVRYCHRVARHSVSGALLLALGEYVRWAEVVHLTAVYSFPTPPTLYMCRLFDRPLVWSPRGSLQRWTGSRNPMLKACWERICRVLAPRHLVLHLTSPDEARESSPRFPEADVLVLPNGVRVPERVAYRPGDGSLRLMYLGRLDPKKGIENLLAACCHLTVEGRLDWSLTIAGGGQSDYAASLERLIGELGLSARVTMIGEVSGDVKTHLFERTDVVVVPSHTENFGMVVAEGLAHGVPVIASRGAPWQRLEETGSGLWVDNAPESLATAIETMSRMPMREMGARGRAWMQREFSWDRRGKEMAEFYFRLIA